MQDKTSLRFEAWRSGESLVFFLLQNLTIVNPKSKIKAYLCAASSYMKKIHIILLILVIASIAGMSFFIKDLTTQETFASAKEKGIKFVVVKADLDKSVPIEFNDLKDPNHTYFYAFDKKGQRMKVVYNNAKPQDMEKSEGIDLNGYMRDGYFECTKLQMKCPSKYKDDMKAAAKNLPTADNYKQTK